MTQIKISNIDRKRASNFGETLKNERESRGLTVEEIATATNLSVQVIAAIDESDLSRLPPPTYVQGYMRTYAKYLDLPSDILIDEFCDLVPHAQETSLRPQSILNEEKNSRTPIVQVISYLLLLIGVFALIYGIVSYYSNKVEKIERQASLAIENDTKLEQINSSQLSLITDANVDNSFEKQNVDSEENIGVGSLLVSDSSEEPTKNVNASTEIDNVSIDVEENVQSALIEDVIDTRGKPKAPGSDVIKLSAATYSSWAEVIDKNNNRLMYRILGKGEEVTLQGTAPFDVFFGNAPAVTVVVNNINVELSDFTRGNNVARFKVFVDSDNQLSFQ